MIAPGTGPAVKGGVTHRIDVRNEGETVLFEFQGLLDAAAMASIDAAVAFARTQVGQIRLVLRAGRAGETFDSLRGPFPLEGKPLLADSAGPFGTPITDSQRVKVQPGTESA